jgi:adenylosuccinate lyase
MKPKARAPSQVGAAASETSRDTGARPDRDQVMLTALSPLDGRYRHVGDLLRPFCSEFALIRYRLTIEVEWLLHLAGEEALADIPAVPAQRAEQLRRWVDGLTEAEAAGVKRHEEKVRHDVKAAEYYLRGRLPDFGLSQWEPFVHFCCTSEDINNVAHALMLRDCMTRVWLPNARILLSSIGKLVRESADLPMIARTHGQPASPTTLGKELAVFVHRMSRQIRSVEKTEYLAKFSGAVGNYNAHVVAYPRVDWIALTKRFLERFGLVQNPLTTQIESHDYMAELFHALIRFNNILINFDRDVWMYISHKYFSQILYEGEVGSSTMPHKVNPIDFENSEANAGVSNGILDHLAGKIAISRLQRDLSDSSALRNVGVGIGHSVLALRAASAGLQKVAIDRNAIQEDLDAEWSVLAEAIQTVLRKHGAGDAYERMKALTQNKRVSPESIRALVDALDLPAEAREQLRALTPQTYIGLAPRLASLVQLQE